MPAKHSLLNSLSFQKLTFLIMISLASSGLSALVDYTESEDFKPKSSGASRSIKKQSPAASASASVKSSVKRSSSGASGRYHFSGSVNYGSQDVGLDGKNGKMDMMEVEALLQTSYNIFAQARYYQASSSDDALVTQSTSFQRGNADIILGFNWLQFGGSSDRATVDLYGGLRLGQDESDFASSRTDRILGVSTAKRFEDFAIGLGYEVQLTGTGNDSEMSIGNISKISASLGWVVSRDIRFLIEGFTYQVSAADSGASSLFLEQELKFSTLNPQLQLKLSPMIDLTLGASFRTRRLKDSVLTSAKLWSLQGAYGRSLFAGLSVSI
jgi:hypothetical protein